MAFNAVMLLRTTIDAKLVFFSIEFFFVEKVPFVVAAYDVATPF